MSQQVDTDIDTAFEQIVGALEVTEIDQRTVPENNKITVLVDLPHLARWGHETTRELVYRCNFTVKEGDKVLCPPTPLLSQWTTGIVIALHGNGYKGPLKDVRKVRDQ